MIVVMGVGGWCCTSGSDHAAHLSSVQCGDICHAEQCLYISRKFP